MENQVYDTVIIGSGPAGCSAAIYNIRANLKTVIIAGDQPGGQLTITTLVDNYPGFPHGIGGVKLMMDMQDQVKNLGGEIRQGLVRNIRYTSTDKSEFEVGLDGGETIVTKTVIVATGAKARWLEIPGERELLGKGVSGCATCDGMFFRDKVIAVVGGGDSACTEADFLAKFGSVVYIIHRRDSLRATPAEQANVINNPKIKLVWNTEVKEALGEEKLTSIKTINNKTGEEKIMPVDGLFVAIGRDPMVDFVKEVGVELGEKGHVITGRNKDLVTMTNIPGIFAAGDCADPVYMQAIVAAGEGCKASIDADRWLKSNG